MGWGSPVLGDPTIDGKAQRGSSSPPKPALVQPDPVSRTRGYTSSPMGFGSFFFKSAFSKPSGNGPNAKEVSQIKDSYFFGVQRMMLVISFCVPETPKMSRAAEKRSLLRPIYNTTV